MIEAVRKRDDQNLIKLTLTGNGQDRVRSSENQKESLAQNSREREKGSKRIAFLKKGQKMLPGVFVQEKGRRMGTEVEEALS